MTPFALLLRVSGLSTKDVGVLFKVEDEVVELWAHGSEPPPPFLITELRWLYRQIVESAELQLTGIRQSLGQQTAADNPPVVEIKMPANDEQALEMGMPTVGVCHVRAGIIVARLDTPVVLIPWN